MVHPNYGTYNTKDMTLYDLLGIEFNATENEITKGYRRAALKFHPDRNSDHRAEEVFDQIRIAHEVLCNETTREKYNASVEASIRRLEEEKKLTGDIKNMLDILNKGEAAAVAKRKSNIKQTQSALQSAKQRQQEDIEVIINQRKRRVPESAADLEASLGSYQQGSGSIVKEAFAIFSANPPVVDIASLETLESRLPA